jgi:hypothetical protein
VFLRKREKDGYCYFPVKKLYKNYSINRLFFVDIPTAIDYNISGYYGSNA